jgi:hypothetical protein
VALTANGANASIAINLSSVSNVGTVAATTNGGTVNSFANNGITFYGTLGPLGSTPQK